MYYGLESIDHAKEIAHEVCLYLGNGSNNTAEDLLLETCAVETQMGLYQDPTPKGAGRGANQIDPIGLDDIKLNSTEHFQEVLEHFGYWIPDIHIDQVQNDPLLSFVLCRLHYKRVPEVIPMTRAKRAEYWKKHYNTELGKGTVKHYLESAARLL